VEYYDGALFGPGKIIFKKAWWKIASYGGLSLGLQVNTLLDAPSSRLAEIPTVIKRDQLYCTYAHLFLETTSRSSVQFPVYKKCRPFKVRAMLWKFDGFAILSPAISLIDRSDAEHPMEIRTIYPHSNVVRNAADTCRWRYIFKCNGQRWCAGMVEAYLPVFTSVKHVNASTSTARSARIDRLFTNTKARPRLLFLWWTNAVNVGDHVAAMDE
jgi:hypothetical protein